MKKLVSIFMTLVCATFVFAQESAQDTISFITKEYYLNDFIYYRTDTFLVVHQVEEYSSNQMISENRNAYLFEVKDGVVESLINEEVEIEDVYEGEPIENTVKDYAQTYVFDLYFGEEEDEFMDGMLFEYYNSNRIEVIKSNVVEISSSSWSYEGGAHGYGIAEYHYYDLDTKSFFDISDCYSEGVLDFIYDKVKYEFFLEDGFGGDELEDHLEFFFEDLDERTEGNRDLESQQYYFTEEGLHIEIQMYDQLYDQDDFYIGYNNWEMLIPYEKLDKFLIKDSALDRMLQK